MHKIPDILRADMERKNIDSPLSLKVLEELNRSLSAGDKSPGIRACPPWTIPESPASKQQRDEGKALVFVGARRQPSPGTRPLPAGTSKELRRQQVARPENSPASSRRRLPAPRREKSPPPIHRLNGVSKAGTTTTMRTKRKTHEPGQ
jgi:hypothetical protein